MADKLPFNVRNIGTAVRRIFSNSKPGEFNARTSIETALSATKRDIATKPVVEPTVISKKGVQIGSIFSEEGLGHNYHKYLERETLRHSRYVMYDRMDTDLIGSALDVYANEATQKNQEGSVVGVFSNSKYIQDELRSMLEDTGINNYRSWSVIRNMCKYGDHFAALKLDSIRGVTGIKDLNPISVYRLEEQDGELLGYVQDLDVLKSAVQNAAITSATMNPYINLNTLSLPYLTGDNVNREDEDSLITFLKYELIHFRLRGKGSFLPYGACLKYNTRVETEFGYKEIKNVEKNDRVWSLDINGNRVLSTVVDTVCSGKKQTYNIATQHNALSASKEHRILVVDQNSDFGYKYPSELQVGDLLAIAKQKIETQDIFINKTCPETSPKNGYWSEINRIPDVVTEDFARLLGFLFGDGWLHGSSVCFAAGIHQSINNKYIEYLEQFTGKIVQLVNPTTTLEYSQVVCGSKMLVTILQQLGFTGIATTKRIPEWLFRASVEVKRAFLLGLVDADGSLFIDKWNCLRYSIELTNEELIRDTKTLVQSLGLKSGKISMRDRTTSSHVLHNGRTIKASVPSWSFYFFDSEIKQTIKYNKRKTEEYILEPIISIALDEVETETWDIQVDSDCHNFFANGIVVHNSVLESSVDVWKKLDLLFDSLIIYRLNRAPTRLVFYVDVGNNQGADAENIVKRQINAITKKEYFNPNGKLNERYQLLDMNANLFIPMQKSSASKVEQLAGVADIGSIEDVAFLNNRLFSALKIPKSFLGYEGDVSSKGMLSQQNVTFSKAIQNIQEDFLESIKDMCLIHLAIRGISDLKQLKSFDLIMTRPSYVEEKARIEVDSTLLQLATSYQQFGVNRLWIAKNILRRTDSEIKDMFKPDPQMQQQQAGAMGGGMPMGMDMGMPMDAGAGAMPPEGAPLPPDQSGQTPGAPPMDMSGQMPQGGPAPDAGMPLTASRRYLGDLIIETADTALKVQYYAPEVKAIKGLLEANGIEPIVSDVRTMGSLVEEQKPQLTEPEEIFNDEKLT